MKSFIKSFMIIGSGQAANTAISIIRLKMIAVMLGPYGIGLFAALNNLQQLVSQLAGLGINSSGVRDLAMRKANEDSFNSVRRTITYSLFIQGMIIAAIIWTAKEWIAINLLGDSAHILSIGVTGISAFLLLMSQGQLAILRGLRKIREMVQCIVIGASVGSAAGLALMIWKPEAGLVTILLIAPGMTFLLASMRTGKFVGEATSKMTLSATLSRWLIMVKMGSMFMIGGLLTFGSLILIRAWIASDLGLDSAGQFAAAWAIGATSVGALLSTIASDFYPKLSGQISDRGEANNLVAVQIEIALAISSPITLLIIGSSHWVIQVLYSGSFLAAASILDWIAVGIGFKLVCAIFSFSFAAHDLKVPFLLSKTIFSCVFVGIVWSCLKFGGIDFIGQSFLIANAINFIVLTKLMTKTLQFRLSRYSKMNLGITVISAALILQIPDGFSTESSVIAFIIAAFLAVINLRRVLAHTGRSKHLSGLFQAYEKVGWPIRDLSVPERTR